MSQRPHMILNLQINMERHLISIQTPEKRSEWVEDLLFYIRCNNTTFIIFKKFCRFIRALCTTKRSDLGLDVCKTCMAITFKQKIKFSRIKQIFI